MKISKIYLDMDGVLCNFERRYFERYNELPGSMRDRKDFNVHWDDFIETNQFETLDWWPGGQELLTYVYFLHSEHEIEVEMLTSSGGQKHHAAVARQKQVWLDSKGIFFKANVVAAFAARSRRMRWACLWRPSCALFFEMVISFCQRAPGLLPPSWR